jgi:hypothetical protein
MLNSAEFKKTPMILLSVALLFIATAIGMILLAVYLGVSSYNARLLAEYTPLQAAVTEHIKAIRDFQKQHNRYPENMEEVGIALPPEWIYSCFRADGVFHKDEQPFLWFFGEKGLLFSFEEGDEGVWKYAVKSGRRSSGFRTYRPLPSNPK